MWKNEAQTIHFAIPHFYAWRLEVKQYCFQFYVFIFSLIAASVVQTFQ